MPTDRAHPLDPPVGLRARAPVSRLPYPDGHLGWLVTGHDAARAVLADPRLSARAELRHSPVSATGPADPAPPGVFIAMDPPDHTRYRRLLTGQFTVRRMRLLEPLIERHTTEHLDAMRRQGPPVDLVEAFALPIPSLAICDLLGVPHSDRDRFQRDTAVIASLDTTPARTAAAMADLTGFLGELVAHKRARPTGDLISDLVRGGEVDDNELTAIAVMLLIAGHETTANMLALGLYALLTNPDQLAALRADPALTDNAVEELLRHLSIVHIGPTRTALEDLTIAGHHITAGENVTVSLPSANRDPARFPRPDRLDLTRTTSGHLAFGHGIHQCLGQQLARVELRVGYHALLHRFPSLRLAVDAAEIQFATDTVTYGVRRLPVTWDQ
nr:cytochrome P450 [Actinophytocola xinjiangensis]